MICWSTVIALILISLSVLGGLVRVSVQDALAVTAPIYYALPPVVASLPLFLSSLLLLKNARLWPSFGCLVVALATGSLAFTQQYRGKPCAAEFTALRVLVWNVGHARKGWAPIAATIQQIDADLVGLIEVGREDRVRHHLGEKQFGEYQIYLPGGGLALLAKVPILEAKFYRFGRRSRAATVQVDYKGNLISVVLTDIESNPFVERAPLLKNPLLFAASAPNLPTIIMGDFNTPRDSVWFQPFRRAFRHAFEEAGVGWAPTWPTFFPVIDTDHVWVSSAFKPQCAKTVWVRHSDHLPLVTELALREEDKVRWLY